MSNKIQLPHKHYSNYYYRSSSYRGSWRTTYVRPFLSAFRRQKVTGLSFSSHCFQRIRICLTWKEDTSQLVRLFRTWASCCRVKAKEGMAARNSRWRCSSGNLVHSKLTAHLNPMKPSRVALIQRRSHSSDE